MNDNNLNNSNNLKPVRCGCGGEGEVHIMGHELTKAQYYINCEKCDTRTWFYDTEVGAITAWNKAMGTEKDCAHCVSYDKVRGYCNNYGLWIGDAFGCKDFAPYCEVKNE